MYSLMQREERIRMEAASQAINRTIQMMEAGLNIRFPRVGTPTENRDAMIEELRNRIP